MKKPFWKQKKLQEMSKSEWESLCDGCGRCCLNKLEDWDTAEIYYTNIACSELDCDTCRCKSYDFRFDVVPDCIDLTPQKVEEITWLPPTCAYRLVKEGKDLHPWHPLISGDLKKANMDLILRISKCLHNYNRIKLTYFTRGREGIF